MPVAPYESGLPVCPMASAYDMSEFCSHSKAFRQDHCMSAGTNASECSLACYPIGDGESYVAGAFCVVNAVVGFSGNLLTMLAIPYARKHNR